MSGFKPTPSKRQQHVSSHHNNSHKSHKHRDPRASAASAQAAGPGHTAAADASFLFVVNELELNLEPPPGSSVLRDPWLNTVPPQSPAAYTNEHVGTVFRYRSGVVTPAPDYMWYRPEGMNQPGVMVRIDGATGHPNGCPTPYADAWGGGATQTMFSCSPHLPVLVTNTDATLGTSFLRRCCQCDSQFGGGGDGCSPWRLLHFERSDEHPGVSFVNACGRGSPCVQGRDPSWMPSLVPTTYQNTYAAGVPQSRGLAGQLPTVIGLMALQSMAGRADEVFASQKWHMCRWNGSSKAPSHVPKGCDDPLRGLLVHVCIDDLFEQQEQQRQQQQQDDNHHNRNPQDYHGDAADENPNEMIRNACFYRLNQLEWHSILVHG
ncbi:hypothetical protein QBC42DRAFT_325325 [Cladorrhinum samala]|uniref:DUF1996 domain-containing protein n=1 Tax=Cladorrhinum samala TaxID=585594 RepID=A0AAV9HSG9_9PEZI|nr:hypothetical protein QBC42DRAFT_325325 [Cladorrhinum samala]